MIRLSGIAACLILFLIILTIARYAGNIEHLRRSSLEQLAEDVARSLRQEEISNGTAVWNQYPKAYGYRVFDESREIVTETNAGLFPKLPRYRSSKPDVSIKHLRTPDPGADQWFMTREEDIGGRRLWIDVTMAGDPAGLWGWSIFHEMFDDVGIPILVFLPALGLSIFLALRSSIMPLTKIAGKARELAREARAGAPLNVLSIDGLPREASNLVEAINTLLQISEELKTQQKEFTANIAHELRTPLSVLLLQISRLPSGAAVNELRADVTEMNRMVDQLLQLAQAEQETKASFAVQDMRGVAQAACEEMAVFASAHDRLIEFDQADTPVMVSYNTEFVKIALRNIIKNGLKFTPPGSTISVAATGDGVITISDCGPGIPEADRERVFQRFWRGEYLGARGAGVGLALVRAIMDLHDGDVRIEDRNCGGCRVVLSFNRVALKHSTLKNDPHNLEIDNLRATA
jgi:signal transduction histidine kinase